MATDINPPIDEVHRQCLIERDNIRREVASAIARVRRWEPAPLPQRERRHD